MPGWAGDDVLARAAEDEGWDDGGVQGADAVDDGLGVTQGLEHAGVGGWADFLAIGVDVPNAGDASGEVLVVCFGELNVLVS